MNAYPAGRLAGGVALVIGLALTSGSTRASTALADPPRVLSAVVDSIIHPVSAEYITATIDRADREGAALVVLTLRTPGGLVESTRAIVSRMVAAKTPVGDLRRAVGRARRIGRVHPHHRGRRRGDGPGHAHRRGASGRRQRPEDGRDDGRRRRPKTWPLMPARWPGSATGTWRSRPKRSARAAPSPRWKRATPTRRSIDLVATDVADLLRQLDGRTDHALRRHDHRAAHGERGGRRDRDDRCDSAC